MVQLTNMHGTIRFEGPDARMFLQGQLTNDLRLLTPERPLLAAHCTPQGRVVAIVELHEENGAIVGRLPAAMIEPLIAKLRRYVLRAKVTMTGATAGGDETNEALLQAITEGRPQVYPATSESFVAQMLNLDLLDGISFNKGCYTGQEIVARAHFRGKVKRRMQRFRTLQPGMLEVGAKGRLTDGRSFEVVRAAALPNGRCEFLAVAPLADVDEAVEGDVAPTEAAATDASGTGSVAVESLSLPYAIS